MTKPDHVFIVVQSAVYRHDVGPFAFTLGEAVELAKKRQLLERDGHHEFDVLKLTAGSLDDGTRVATVSGRYESVEARGTYACGGHYKYNKQNRIEGFDVKYY